MFKAQNLTSLDDRHHDWIMRFSVWGHEKKSQIFVKVEFVG